MKRHVTHGLHVFSTRQLPRVQLASLRTECLVQSSTRLHPVDLRGTQSCNGQRSKIRKPTNQIASHYILPCTKKEEQCGRNQIKGSINACTCTHTQTHPHVMQTCRDAGTLRQINYIFLHYKPSLLNYHSSLPSELDQQLKPRIFIQTLIRTQTHTDCVPSQDILKWSSSQLSLSTSSLTQSSSWGVCV